MITSHRVTLTLVVAASVVALSIGGALAQTAGRGKGGGPSVPGGGGGSTVLVYGGPENCPPTIACGPAKKKAVVVPQRCDRWEIVRTASGRKQRHCVDH